MYLTQMIPGCAHVHVIELVVYGGKIVSLEVTVKQWNEFFSSGNF